MKKKILYIAVLAICLSILTGGTLAYYTASDTARNVITSGSVSVQVRQYQRIGDTLQPFPSQPIPVMPGTTVSKIVTVESMEQAAWIRVNFAVTVYDPAGNQMEITPEEQASLIAISPDEENWMWKDGWWYYKAPVGSGEETLPLFESVSFSGPGMGNQYQRCSIIIDITAQGVQKANNGESVMDAMGWPES